MGSPAIRAEGLSKRYGDTLALDALDLDGRAGRGLRLPRPERRRARRRRSGCCSGCTVRRAGRAELFGVDAWREPVAAHRRVAYVAGEPFLWPALTSAETFDVSSRACTAATDERVPRRRSSSASSSTPTKKVRALSKGNRQKVQLVAAFATRADLLILDEPTSGLDPLMEMAFRETVLEAKERGPDGLPLVAHPQRGRGAVRPRRHPPPRTARRRGDARRAAAPQRADDRGDVRRRRRPSCRRSTASTSRRAGANALRLRGHRQRRTAARGARRSAGRGADEPRAVARGDLPPPLRRRGRRVGQLARVARRTLADARIAHDLVRAAVRVRRGRERRRLPQDATRPPPTGSQFARELRREQERPAVLRRAARPAHASAATPPGASAACSRSSPPCLGRARGRARAARRGGRGPAGARARRRRSAAAPRSARRWPRSPPATVDPLARARSPASSVARLPAGGLGLPRARRSSRRCRCSSGSARSRASSRRHRRLALELGERRARGSRSLAARRRRHVVGRRAGCAGRRRSAGSRSCGRSPTRARRSCSSRLAAAVRCCSWPRLRSPLRRDVGTRAARRARQRAAERRACSARRPRRRCAASAATLVAWLAGIGVFAFVVGVLSDSVSTAEHLAATSSEELEEARRRVDRDAGRLRSASTFLFFVFAVSLFGCSQVAAARREEADQRLETLLALPGRAARAGSAGGSRSRSRRRRCSRSSPGVLAWAGAASQGADVSLAEHARRRARTACRPRCSSSGSAIARVRGRAAREHGHRVRARRASRSSGSCSARCSARPRGRSTSRRSTTSGSSRRSRSAPARRPSCSRSPRSPCVAAVRIFERRDLTGA